MSSSQFSVINISQCYVSGYVLIFRALRVVQCPGYQAFGEQEMALTLKYGDILAASPMCLERVEGVSKRFEEVKQFAATLRELCRELDARMVSTCTPLIGVMFPGAPSY